MPCLPVQVDLQAVNRELQGLKPPAGGAPDPVTKLWPRHLSQQAQQGQHARSTNPHLQHAREQEHSFKGYGNHVECEDDLLRRFPDYFKQYGYQ